MIKLQAALFSRPRYGAGEKIELSFRLMNLSNTDVRVLKWLTPLEDLNSDCLRVTRNGERIPYDGLLVKRSTTPPEEAYATIAVGDSISATLSLQAAYQASLPGLYAVALQSEIYAMEVEELERLINFRGNRDHTLFTILTRNNRFQLSDSATNFEVVGEGARIRTIGEEYRLKSDRSDRERARTTGVVLPPQVVGGDGGSQQAATQAHSDGYGLASTASNALAQDSWYGEWFGAYSESRFQTVQQHFRSIISDMETITYTYDLTGQGCQAGWYAYTSFGSSTIYLCAMFLAAPAQGTDSKAGTVVHEHSHASANTVDTRYGQAACQQLASDDPDSAIMNADSHEYFARG